jgi:hypothetical protein
MSRLKPRTQSNHGRPATHGLGRGSGEKGDQGASLYKDFVANARKKIEECSDALERAEVMLDMLTEASLRTLEGRGTAAMNKELRAFASSIARLIPKVRLYAAEQVVLGNRVPAKPTNKAGGGKVREVVSASDADESSPSPMRRG